MLYFFRAAGRTFSQGSSMLTLKDLKISTEGPELLFVLVEEELGPPAEGGGSSAEEELRGGARVEEEEG